MKKALSAYGVAWVLAMADKYEIERGKLLQLFTDLAPEEEEKLYEEETNGQKI